MIGFLEVVAAISGVLTALTSVVLLVVVIAGAATKNWTATRNVGVVFGVFFSVFIIVFIVGSIVDPGFMEVEEKSEPARSPKLRSTPVPKLSKDEKCLRDLDCAAGKSDWFFDAGTECAPYIEAYAQYRAKWTEGFFGSKFSRVGLRPRYDSLRFTGDKVEFQNGYGAWQQMDYACFYNPLTKTVIDVKVW